MDTALPAPDAALRGVARRFEAQALGALLKPIFGEALKTSFSGGSAEAQWRPMLIDEYARAWTDRGGIGLADAVYRELLNTQAQQQGEAG